MEPETDGTVEEFLEKAEREDSQGWFRHAVNTLLNGFLDLLDGEHYADVDVTLARVDVTKMSSESLVSILATTWAARQHLEQRASFFDRAYDAIAARVGHERARRVLEKYQGGGVLKQSTTPASPGLREAAERGLAHAERSVRMMQVLEVCEPKDDEAVIAERLARTAEHQADVEFIRAALSADPQPEGDLTLEQACAVCVKMGREIANLTAENARLKSEHERYRAALQPFADIANYATTGKRSLTNGDYERAAEVMRPEPSPSNPETV